MKTYEDCIPCLLRQAYQVAELVTDDKTLQNSIIDEMVRIAKQISFDSPPPETARTIHKGIMSKLDGKDPYKAIKDKSNEMALALYPRLKERVENSEDRLLTALEVAITGNVIDYGAKNLLDIESEIERLFNGDFQHEKKTIFEYDNFKKDLKNAKRILYLADNAGEVVFDRVLIEELCADKEIMYIVRDKPIINDALEEDARVCGIDKIAKIISSGVDAPGTILKYCSKEFLEIYKSTELIISKGQGNYEALSDEKKPIYFLLKIKCPVIARNVGAEIGDTILKKAIPQNKS